MRNKLQHKTIVLRLKNHCIQCDDIDMLQDVSLCFTFQLTSRSVENNSKIIISNYVVKTASPTFSFCLISLLF